MSRLLLLLAMISMSWNAHARPNGCVGIQANQTAKWAKTKLDKMQSLNGIPHVATAVTSCDSKALFRQMGQKYNPPAVTSSGCGVAVILQAASGQQIATIAQEAWALTEGKGYFEINSDSVAVCLKW